jgi:hypothetical protein
MRMRAARLRRSCRQPIAARLHPTSHGRRETVNQTRPMYVNVIKLMILESANRWQANVFNLSYICQLKVCLLVIHLY